MDLYLTDAPMDKHQGNEQLGEALGDKQQGVSRGMTLELIADILSFTFITTKTCFAQIGDWIFGNYSTLSIGM